MLDLSKEHHYSPSSDTPQLMLSDYQCFYFLQQFVFFYRVGLLTLCPTSSLKDQGVNLCLVSTLETFRHEWPYQEYKTPTDIALGVIETCKLPHHGWLYLEYKTPGNIALGVIDTCKLPHHGWPYLEYKTPADIALGAIETYRLPHRVKAVTPFAFQ